MRYLHPLWSSARWYVNTEMVTGIASVIETY